MLRFTGTHGEDRPACQRGDVDASPTQPMAGLEKQLPSRSASAEHHPLQQQTPAWCSVIERLLLHTQVVHTPGCWAMLLTLMAMQTPSACRYTCMLASSTACHKPRSSQQALPPHSMSSRLARRCANTDKKEENRWSKHGSCKHVAWTVTGAAGRSCACARPPQQGLPCIIRSMQRVPARCGTACHTRHTMPSPDAVCE